MAHAIRSRFGGLSVRFFPSIPRVSTEVVSVSCSERRKEIKRRRHRQKKVEMYKQRLAKATVSEKQHIAGKLREMTPGAEAIVQQWSLDDR